MNIASYAQEIGIDPRQDKRKKVSDSKVNTGKEKRTLPVRVELRLPTGIGIGIVIVIVIVIINIIYQRASGMPWEPW